MPRPGSRRVLGAALGATAAGKPVVREPDLAATKPAAVAAHLAHPMQATPECRAGTQARRSAMLGRNSCQGSAPANCRVQWRHWSCGVGAGVVLAWLSPACLNPHTDDQPTFVGDPTVVNNPQPASCNDNPLLAGCDDGLGGRQPVNTGSASAAGGTGAGAPASPPGSAGQGGLMGSGGSGGLPASEQDGGVPDAGDAGVGDADVP